MTLPKCALVVLLAVQSIVAAGFSQARTAVQSDDPRFRYLGQTPPGHRPERFAPGVVSTPAIEINGVFTPDFREFVFARQVDKRFMLFRSTRKGNQWSPPQPLPVYPDGARGVAVDMAFSPDGREMFFMGRYKPGLPLGEGPFDIWVSRRKDDGWTTAETVPPPVSTEAFESYPTVVADGSLYFVSNRPGGVGRSDIYRASRLADGRFGDPVNIGPPVNTANGEGDPFISPDERYLIVTTGRAGGFGDADLYVAFRTADGGWSEPVNLGDTINTPATEFCPMVTPDGRYLFFSRRVGSSWETATDADVYWVDIDVIARMRKEKAPEEP